MGSGYNGGLTMRTILKPMEKTAEKMMKYYHCSRSMVDRLYAYNEQYWEKFPNRDKKLFELMEKGKRFLLALMEQQKRYNKRYDSHIWELNKQIKELNVIVNK